MSKKTWTSTALILAALSLTGCGGAANSPHLTSDPVDAATDSSPESTATATAAERSPRGALIKEVGEPAARGMEGSDEWALNFTVTGIEVDPVCAGPYAEPPQNGHFVVISVEATTGPEPGFTEATGGSVSFSEHLWKAIGTNGTRANTVASTATYSCLPIEEQVPTSLGAAEKVAGKVVLDVPDAAGTLVYDDGWEWEYGTK